MEIAPRYWQDPSALNQIYVSTSGANPTGVQQTGIAAGDYTSSTGPASTAASIAADSARNLATNAIAASGHSTASTGAAVTTSLETMVPLSAFATYEPGHTPLSVNHQGQFAATTIQSGAWPVAERSEDGDRQGDRAHRHALDRPRRVPRNGGDLSAIAIEHAASLRRRSRRSRSRWGFYESLIRSPYSRRCSRPASARRSHCGRSTRSSPSLPPSASRCSSASSRRTPS